MTLVWTIDLCRSWGRGLLDRFIVVNIYWI